MASRQVLRVSESAVFWMMRDRTSRGSCDHRAGSMMICVLGWMEVNWRKLGIRGYWSPTTHFVVLRSNRAMESDGKTQQRDGFQEGIK